MEVERAELLPEVSLPEHAPGKGHHKFIRCVSVGAVDVDVIVNVGEGRARVELAHQWFAGGQLDLDEGSARGGRLQGGRGGSFVHRVLRVRAVGLGFLPRHVFRSRPLRPGRGRGFLSFVS